MYIDQTKKPYSSILFFLFMLCVVASGQARSIKHVNEDVFIADNLGGNSQKFEYSRPDDSEEGEFSRVPKKIEAMYFQNNPGNSENEFGLFSTKYLDLVKEINNMCQKFQAEERHRRAKGRMHHSTALDKYYEMLCN